VVKSDWMRDEVARIYKVPVEKIRVVHPGTTTWLKEVFQSYQDSIKGGQSP
jgi:hypothetical protein